MEQICIDRYWPMRDRMAEAQRIADMIPMMPSSRKGSSKHEVCALLRSGLDLGIRADNLEGGKNGDHHPTPQD
jgi:hypothetical protein